MDCGTLDIAKLLRKIAGASLPGVGAWRVGIRAADSVKTFELGTFDQVFQLERCLEARGFRMSILDEETACDFLFAQDSAAPA